MDLYTHNEIVDASDRLYQALCVAELIKGLSENGNGITDLQTDDLGKLLIRLIDWPLTVLNGLRSETQGDAS